MSDPRFDPETGLPFGLRVEGPKEDEKKRVAMYRAQLSGAKKVWDRHKTLTDEMRRRLAGPHFGGLEGGGVVFATQGSASTQMNPIQYGSNLFLRAQRLLKAEAGGEEWSARAPLMGDIPDEITDEIEAFYERLGVHANVTQEFCDALDDGGTQGQMVIWMGCERSEAIDREAMAGASTPISDLAQAAAMGDTTIHPMKGMDYIALAKSCRDLAADESQVFTRTIEQRQNLIRLAQEADTAYVKQVEECPEGYSYGGLLTRRLVYGEDVWWDSSITTRWQDARVLFIEKLFTEAEAQAEKTWKKSARSKLKAVDTTVGESGHNGVADSGLTPEENASLNKRVAVIEVWDRDTAEVHYITKTGGYDGFLERDSRYPYRDGKGMPVFPHFFPVVACVPVVHNLRTNDRTLGIPWLYPGLPAARRYEKFSTALVNAQGRGGRVAELPSGIPTDVVDQLKAGADLVVIERPSEIQGDKPLVTLHDWGEAPMDFEKAKNEALYEFAREVDISVEQISGRSMEDTLGQAEMAARGATTARGGLIRKLQTFGGEVLRNLGLLAAHLWTDERATMLMGLNFTKREPVMGPDGMPAMDPTTQEPIKSPSIWDLFKASSPMGDQVQVIFSPSQQDLIRQKAEDDTIALLSGPAGMNPLDGLPWYDPRPIWERVFKTRGMGRPLPFPRPPPMPPGEPAEGSPGDGPEDKAEGGSEERQAPGGGRTDGRAARGMRGPPAVPGRQGRGEGPGDFGDQSVRTNRMSTQ